MSFDRAKAALSGTRFADLRWVPETGSTNADLRDELAAGGPRTQPIVLVADHQTAGRGRRGRDWQAPAGTSLLMTIALPVAGIRVERRPLLSTALALAVTDAQPQLSIKWPNDLVVPVAAADRFGYRKVGGILAESHPLPAAGEWVLLGIGLNVNWPDLPVSLTDAATSLDRIVGHLVDREDLAVAILRSLELTWLPLVEQPGTTALFEAYRDHSATIGQRVRVQLQDSELVGTATDLAATGALQVVDDHGRRHTVTVGDVVHLRPIS